jgi:tetratricopeptide (TPR) repeat protein
VRRVCLYLQFCLAVLTFIHRKPITCSIASMGFCFYILKTFMPPPKHKSTIPAARAVVSRRKGKPAPATRPILIVKKVNEYLSETFSLLSKLSGIVVLIMLALWIVREYRSNDYVLETPKVSLELEKAGYDPLFITSQIVSRFEEIRLDAQSNLESSDKFEYRVTGSSEYVSSNIPPQIRTEVMGVSFNLGQVLDFATELFGREKKFIKCTLIENKADVALYLKVKDFPMFRIRASNTDLDRVVNKLLDSAAMAVLNASDPTTVAYYYFRNRKFDMAEKYAMSIIRRDHKDKKWAYNLIGKIYNETLRYDEAIAPLKEAVKIDPTFISALNNLGIAYSYSTQENGKKIAVQTFERCIYLDKENEYPYARFMLGLTWNDLDSAELALSYFKACNRIDSNAFYSMNDMAYAYNKLAIHNNVYYDSSLTVLAQALELTKGMPSEQGRIWTTIGETHLAAGDTTKFFECVAKAIDLGFVFEDEHLENPPYSDFLEDERFLTTILPAGSARSGFATR